MQIKKTIVSGATGFVGRELATQLQAIGVSVLAIGRSHKEGPWDGFIEQDFNQSLGIHLSGFDHVDCIFHLAGIAHAESGKFKWQDYYQVNTKATIDLLEAAGQSGVKKFVFVSRVKAVADPSDNRFDKCIDESWTKKPTDDYGKSKFLAEEAVAAISNKYNMDYVIVRPTLVYGPAIKGNLLKMIAAIDDGKFPPIPKINNKRSLVHVADLCKALILVANKNEASGNTYIVSDQKNYSTRDIYEAMMLGLGKPLGKLFVPIVCFYSAAKVGDFMEKSLGRKMPVNSAAIAKLFGSACYDGSKIEKELGFEPDWTLQRAMPQIVASYRNKPCK